MERLTFSDSTAYNGLEAAIHSARYSIVRPMCSDKRVLDVACGEGYGCHLMSAWGARHVDGVDVSAEAVEGARRLFGSDTVYFTKDLSLIHISEPTRLLSISYAVFCLKKKKN